MKKILLKTICIIQMICILFLYTSCNKEESMSDIESVFYESNSYSINQECRIDSIFQLGDEIKIIVNVFDIENDIDSYYLYTINDNGIDNGVLLSGEVYGTACSVGVDRFACLGNGSIVIFDKECNIIKSVDIEDHITGRMDFVPVEEGFVVLGYESAVLYDYDANKIDEIFYGEALVLAEDSPCYVYDGKIYLITDGRPGTSFYELNFNQGSCTYVGNEFSFMLNDDSTIYRYGGFVFDEVDGFIGKLNMDEMSVEKLVLLENCMVIPPRYLSTFNNQTYILSEDAFVKTYTYNHGVLDIVVVKKCQSDTYSSRIKLNVQGVAINQDLVMLWTAYLYNMSQDEYLVCLQDFGEAYAYANAQEAQQAKLNLISEFEDGNAPDIFYGNDFDYQYWGRNGMVLNIAEYIDPSVLESMNDGIRDVIIADGAMYHAFSGYTMFGYAGSRSQYPLQEYSIYNLPELDEGQRRWSLLSAIDIMDSMVRHGISNNVNIEELLSEETLFDMLSIAISEGVNPMEYSQFGTPDGVYYGEYSLWLTWIRGDMRDFFSQESHLRDELSFIGLPSVNDSIHLVNPSSNVAISSATEHPEACADFIEIMLSDEVQRYNYSKGTIPVSESILNEYIEYMRNPESIPEDAYTYQELARMEVGVVDENGRLTVEEGFVDFTDEQIDRYIQTIMNTDTYQLLDWGIYNIISEEVISYYQMNKSIEEIAVSLSSRLELYYQENYG